MFAHKDFIDHRIPAHLSKELKTMKREKEEHIKHGEWP